ncbi:hypothetical protein JCM8547_005286 [Rhodosporidiobolus lusitaniae]
MFPFDDHFPAHLTSLRLDIDDVLPVDFSPGFLEELSKLTQLRQLTVAGPGVGGAEYTEFRQKLLPTHLPACLRELNLGRGFPAAEVMNLAHVGARNGLHKLACWASQP